MLLLSLLGTSLAESVYAPSVMWVVPVMRSDFGARSSIKASFRHNVPKLDQTIVANMTIETKFPTLHIDNFVQIENVNCTTDLIQLKFDLAATAMEAYNEWSKYNLLALMISHEHRCQGSSKVTTLVVQAIYKPSDQILEIDTRVADRDEVIENFELEITRFDTPGLKATLPLDINYDRTTQMAKNKAMILTGNSDAYVACINCHTTGNATLGLYIKSSYLTIQEYRIGVAGNLKASIDLEIKAGEGSSKEIAMAKLWSSTIDPIQVPGMFQFAPELALMAQVGYTANAALDFTAGYDIDFEFDFSIKSSNGLFSVPTVDYKGLPTSTPHTFNGSASGIADVHGTIVPKFKSNLQLFEQEVADFTFSIDNSLHVDTSDQLSISQEKCEEGKFVVEMDRSHLITFKIGGVVDKLFELWNSGVINIPCSICKMCF